jgi:hypothetical protein
MTTLFSLLALSAYAATFPVNPSWHSDYSAAAAQGIRENKPLAIFLAPGPAAWDKVLHDGTLSPDAQRLLTTKYVPVYLNTETAPGRRLASSFEMPGGVGLVLSDREGERQAYWHEGILEVEELTRALEKNADRDGPVLKTETNLVTQTSSYGPPPVPVTPAPFYPQQAFPFQPSFGAACSH